MVNSSTDSRARSADRLYLVCLIIYLGTLLCFSSFFYLATEDYELVVASRLIGEGAAIGRSTGWPYAPLAPYLFYPYSAFFGENILAFRIVTACFILVSVLPIYWVLRCLCPPFLSFALTLFSFSLTTFPHPRLEYYVEAAFLSVAIYFAVKVIRESKRRDGYLCATFLFAAFASRGFPNVAILVGVMPLALVLVHKLIRPADTFFTRRLASSYWLRWKWWGGLLLFLYCTGFFIKFMKEAVHDTFFHEYVSINSPVYLEAIKEAKSLFALILPGILLIIYLFVAWAKICPPWSKTKDILGDPGTNRDLDAYQVLVPFMVCGLVFLTIGFVMYPLKDVFFFLFPLDLFLDHTRQLSSGRSYVIPLFISLLALTLFLHLCRETSWRKTRVALFLILLLPAAFARFFPTYNLLYLASFAIAVFLCLILPRITRNYFKDQGSVAPRIQWTLAIFLLLYAMGSNLTLLVVTQLSDLSSGRLLQMDRGPMKGVYVEKDVVEFFRAVHSSVEKIAAPEETFAFLSNRYLNYVPLIYGYRDALAGQNLVTGLGKLWSFDDVLKRNGVHSESRFDLNGMIYNWRNVGLEKIEQSNARVIVMSLYRSDIVGPKLEPSSDPFREYLRKNFIVGKVIEPAMKIHRRSRFSEGAVIFIRKGGF